MGAFDDLMTPQSLSRGGAFDDLMPKGSVSRTEKFLTGAADPIHGGAQLLANILPQGLVRAGNTANNWLADKTGLVPRLPEGGVDQQVRERERAYQSQRTAAGESGFDGYRVIGNVLSPANAALAMRGLGAATTGARVLGGAATGGASALLNPVTEGDFASEKGKQVATGAAFGAAVPAATAAIGRLISPAASRNADLSMLRDAGVRPTIGQAMGGRWNALEEKAQSIPLIGDMIANRRGAAQQDFNRAAIQRAAAPIGAKVDDIGQTGVAKAGDAIGDAYDAAARNMGAFRLDRQAIGEIRTVQGMAQNLADKERGQFSRVWQTVTQDISPNGTIPQSAFKKIDSKLGQEASRFSGSPDVYQQQLGDAIGELRNTIKGNALRANPAAATQAKAADRAYANLVRLEGASKAAQNSEGVFTPAQLASAVRQADRSVRDRATARGEALMQDLSRAGQNVLGNKVPNSFTTDRAIIGMGALGAGAYISPMATAGLLGGAGLYTSPAQRMAVGLLASRPQSAEAIRQSLLQASPGLVPLGSQVGLGLLNSPSP